MSDESTTAKIEQQREIATAVAEISALRREHSTAMVAVNSTCSEIKDALKEIFAWHRDMERKYNDATWHCAQHGARLDAHDLRLSDHNGRVRTLEERRDDESSTDELAAAVATRISEANAGGITGFLGRPAVLWPILAAVVVIAIIAAFTGRDIKTITPPLPLTTGDK